MNARISFQSVKLQLCRTRSCRFVYGRYSAEQIRFTFRLAVGLYFSADFIRLTEIRRLIRISGYGGGGRGL